MRNLFAPAVFVAGVAGAAIGLSLAAPGDSQTAACRVVDGDTLNCSGERIRLLGIDAPELPGQCAVNRQCVAGDPFESTRSLESAMTGNLRFTRVGTDRYGRKLALVAGSKGDLSCWQLSHGEASYKPQWDNDGRLAAICPSAR
jgi:endonuclease YncB( thermonuclease family)